MPLQEYNRKRKFDKTPEPRGIAKKDANRRHRLRFVIQKHYASRLHYDFRLETEENVLKSWAVPKGVSLDPKVKRLAVLTEDHPLDYIDFEGEIPEGNYGAGMVSVWDTGTFTTDGDIESQFKKGDIKFTLYGQKVKGKFALVRMKDKQWLLIKKNDEYASEADITRDQPDSVLGKTNGPTKHINRVLSLKGRADEFPESIKPMLATPVNKPFDNKDWVFEIKWDGVRSILFQNKTKDILKLQSRKGNDIIHRYPEIVAKIDNSVRCKQSVVLDGEIVILDKEGKPDFQCHQGRMNVNSKRDIEQLARESPATYFVFDILYLDGQNLEGLEFVERRAILDTVIGKPERIRISDYVEETGIAVYKSAIEMKLEGIVAKYKYSKYQQGSRSSAWLKIKAVQTLDCVVIGYTRGEGNRRNYFGSLILAAYNRGKLRFIGHSGSGLGFDQLEFMLKKMQKLRIDHCPIDHVPYVNREPVWLKPELVVEVKFSEWTRDMIMRAPIFLRFREDKSPQECTIESPKPLENVVSNVAKNEPAVAPKESKNKLTFTNLGKVYWPATADFGALKKKDLIDYYDRVSPYILPHLRDRPLSLSRYPDGILGKSFYHKNWEQAKPEFVKTIKVYSETGERVINYIMCNNKETLLWLANLACIEMHPWYSRVRDFSACVRQATRPGKNAQSLDSDRCGLGTPDFIVFDLDPYIYSGKEAKNQEPEYNVKGFKASVDVALDLRELFSGLKIASYVKTSGKTGLHIFVPIAPIYTYEQTRMFAEITGKILQRKNPGKITMEWNTAARKGKVFFDYNQNAKGKTVASVFSARPTRSATVSMPVKWEKLEEVLPTHFTMLNVPEILSASTDPWADIVEKKQDLGRLLDTVSEAA